MKGMVFFMIAVMLIGAFIIARGGGASDGKNFFGRETAYCKGVAERKRAEAAGDYTGEYKGRFADFLHGCF